MNTIIAHREYAAKEAVDDIRFQVTPGAVIMLRSNRLEVDSRGGVQRGQLQAVDLGAMTVDRSAQTNLERVPTTAPQRLRARVADVTNPLLVWAHMMHFVQDEEAHIVEGLVEGWKVRARVLPPGARSRRIFVLSQ